MKRVVIVGGGIPGLAAAHALERGQERCEVRLIEASPNLGGNLVTVRHNGFIIDAGPDSWVASKPHATRLAKDLGLGDELIGVGAYGREARDDEGKEPLLLAGEVFEQRLAEGLDAVADLVQLVFELGLTALHAGESVPHREEEATQLAMVVCELLQGVSHLDPGYWKSPPGQAEDPALRPGPGGSRSDLRSSRAGAPLRSSEARAQWTRARRRGG